MATKSYTFLVEIDREEENTNNDYVRIVDTLTKEDYIFTDKAATTLFIDTLIYIMERKHKNEN